MQSIPGLSPIIDHYDAVLLDLWGVVHDGTALYPGVREALAGLKKAGKRVVFISNAPRRATKVITVLNELGIEPGWYEHVMSSGEAAFHWLQAGNVPFGKRYYYIGPDKDADVMDGLDYAREEDLKKAGFLLNTGFGTEEQSSVAWTPVLREAQALQLPMLCLNPDMEVVKITGERYPCAGVIAAEYEKLGGEVMWFGKPYPLIYERCMQLLSSVEKSRILAVGDSMTTDILGASRFGLDSVLVTDGILKKRSLSDIEAMGKTLGAQSTYVMSNFKF